MLPDTDNHPAPFQKRMFDKPVSRSISSQLLHPECAVIFRHFDVLRAGMPKAAIYKHSHMVCPKDEVRLAKHRLVSAPAGDSVVTE